MAAARIVTLKGGDNNVNDIVFPTFVTQNNHRHLRRWNMQHEKKTEKKPYATPRLIVLGDIEAVTLGTSDGDFTDAAFPQNTPRRLLTFS
jgi:hypothetical protein